MEAFIARDTPDGIYYSLYDVTDTVLLLDGTRPAAAVIIANVKSVPAARLADRNVVIDLARAFDVNAVAVAGAAPYANVTCALSCDVQRLDGIRDDHGSSHRFAVSSWAIRPLQFRPLPRRRVTAGSGRGLWRSTIQPTTRWPRSPPYRTPLSPPKRGCNAV